MKERDLKLCHSDLNFNLRREKMIYIDGNLIATAEIIQSELDKAAVAQSTSGWMELNSELVQYSGGAEVKIPNLDMDGLADYDRANGFTAGDVKFGYQTKKLTMDRGRSFSFDEHIYIFNN